MTTPVLLPLLLLLVACLGEAALQRKALGSEAGAGSYNVTWKSSVSITAFDGTILRADAFVPVPSSPTELFPVIIFPNSWGVPQIEYILRAWNIAERGFIGFEYETRGWYISGGEIDTAGPKDRKDASSMIDFILAQKDWQPDPNKIAFVGISYGAGISLMMAGYDPRVTTSVVMSGWNNITDMLYGNQSPNLQVNHLVNSALRHGRLSQEILQMRDDLLAHRNMSFVLNFSLARCPQDWVAAMNARQVPLFISANYEDDIFRPQYMTAFFENVLTVPRRMLLNEGGHAAPEAVGLLVHDNYIWHRVGEWLAYWLQGVENGVMNGPMIEMQVGPGIASPNYLPVSNMKQTSMTFFMGPRGADGRGTLNTTIPTAGSAVESPIVFSLSPGFSAGTGKETEMDLGEEYVVSLVQNTSTSVVWVSEPLASTVYVCGIPNVTLSFRTNDESWQFYTTVYDVSPTNTSQGSLLTHGFFSWYENGPVTSAGQQAATRNSADGSWTITGVKQHNMCRQVLVGHSIAVALVLSEQNAFKAAKEDPSLSLSVLYRGASSVTIPIVYGQ